MKKLNKITTIFILVAAMLLCFAACEDDKQSGETGGSAVESQELENSTVTTVISVDGMTCGNCVAAVTRELSAMDGIIGFDVKIGKVMVEHETDVAVADIKETIMSAGYTPLD